MIITLEKIMEHHQSRSVAGRMYFDNILTGRESWCLLFQLPKEDWEILSMIVERGARGTGVSVNHRAFVPKVSQLQAPLVQSSHDERSEDSMGVMPNDMERDFGETQESLPRVGGFTG